MELIQQLPEEVMYYMEPSIALQHGEQKPPVLHTTRWDLQFLLASHPSIYAGFHFSRHLLGFTLVPVRVEKVGLTLQGSSTERVETRACLTPCNVSPPPSTGDSTVTRQRFLYCRVTATLKGLRHAGLMELIPCACGYLRSLGVPYHAFLGLHHLSSSSIPVPEA